MPGVEALTVEGNDSGCAATFDKDAIDKLVAQHPAITSLDRGR